MRVKVLLLFAGYFQLSVGEGRTVCVFRKFLNLLITCSKCQKHYVGETSRALRKRMYEHKSSAQKDGQITPVSRHFKSDGHSHKHMQFTVLEWCTPKFESSNTSRRRCTELSWIFRLHSLAPIGINQFV